MNSFYLVLGLALTALADISVQENAPSERELRRDLFRDYDKHARPVKKHATSVPVKINMSPLSVKYMSEEVQLIILESWMLLTWTDEYLTWNPEEYDNITEIHVPPSEVWRPDIALYTASSDTSYFPTVQAEIIIYNNGSVLWVPPFTVNSRCPTTFQNSITSSKTFVECNIRMGSWTYSGKMLDLQLYSNEVDVSDFLDYNHEWKLVKVVSDRQSKLYPCCPDEYPHVDFNITLKRRNNDLNLGNNSIVPITF